MRNASSLLQICRMIGLASAMFVGAAQGTEVIDLTIDTTLAENRLFESEMLLPVTPGTRCFWHPNWLPGVTGPTGQVSNLVGIVFEDDSGETLTWRRDARHANKFCVSVPDGVTRMRVKLKYIANNPTRLSTSVDCFGADDLVVLNFNACLLYPDVEDVSQLRYRVRVRLPDSFGYGCALAESACAEEFRGDPAGNTIAFGPVGLDQLVDSPLIAGLHYREVPLPGNEGPTTRLCLVGESRASLELSSDRIEQVARLMPEAVRLFGGAPFNEYSFLIVCSDNTPRFGLEHKSSSLMVVREEALQDDMLFRYRAAYLLSHELSHAWCGKLRQPRAMATGNFHTPLETELLWVYEGLTQYLMQLIAVRSEQISFEYHLGYMAKRVSQQTRRDGRAWRSLADTAIAASSLRSQPSDWRDLRRSQDYYDEGALFWLRVDCLLRAASDGALSIDDFCREFFRVQDPEADEAYDLQDVITCLDRLSPGPWRYLIDSLIYQPHKELELTTLLLAGYRLEDSASQSEHLAAHEKIRGVVSVVDSLGLVTDTRGDIRSVRPGSPASLSGLRPDSRIIAINDTEFSRAQLHKAIRRSGEANPLRLIVRDNDEYQVHNMAYRQGARYPTLVRDDKQPDRLKRILRLHQRSRQN